MVDPAPVADDGIERVPLDALLKEVEATVRRYCILSSEDAYVAVTLWVAATYGQKIWDNAPRLAIVSPEKRCGKSRLMEIVGAMSHKPDEFMNASVAAIFRSIHKHDPPTLLIDEADTIFADAKKGSEANAELRGLLNSGHRRGGAVKRCVDFGQTVVSFPTFAMAALTSIRDLPDTIMDRAVVIRMRRRRAGETVAPFRLSRDLPGVKAIGAKLEAWSTGLEDPPEADNPLEDRAADTWEPLLVCAELAGGGWPARGRQAALALVGAESGRPVGSLNLDLLADLREVWPPDEERVFSERLIGLLTGNVDSGTNWGDYRGKGPITARDMAFLLKDYELAPVTVKVKGKAKKGYKIEEMRDVWIRYLPEPVTDEAS